MLGQREPVKVLVRVKPGARKNEIIGFQEDVLLLKIAALPVKGKANRELIAFLSEILGIRKCDILIEKGETAKKKIVGISVLTKAQIKERIAAKSSAGIVKLL